MEKDPGRAGFRCCRRLRGRTHQLPPSAVCARTPVPSAPTMLEAGEGDTSPKRQRGNGLKNRSLAPALKFSLFDCPLQKYREIEGGGLFQTPGRAPSRPATLVFSLFLQWTVEQRFGLVSPSPASSIFLSASSQRGVVPGSLSMTRTLLLFRSQRTIISAIKSSASLKLRQQDCCPASARQSQTGGLLGLSSLRFRFCRDNRVLDGRPIPRQR